MTLNDYIKKNFEGYRLAKITEYRNNHPEAINKDDSTICQELGLYLSDGNVVGQLLLYCAGMEIEREIAHAKENIITGFREDDVEAWEYTNEQIMQMVPLSWEEINFIIKNVYDKIDNMLDKEIRELEEEYESNMVLLRNPNTSSQLVSELNHDSSSTLINLTMVRNAKRVFDEESRGASR